MDRRMGGREEGKEGRTEERKATTDSQCTVFKAPVNLGWLTASLRMLLASSTHAQRVINYLIYRRNGMGLFSLSMHGMLFFYIDENWERMIKVCVENTAAVSLLY